MVDAEKRDKAIRGLELCAYDPDPGQELKEIRSCPECPYYRAGCSPQLIRDALALLKEQEAVKPIGGYGCYICGVCKNPLTSVSQKFCSVCGKAVKWDD